MSLSNKSFFDAFSAWMRSSIVPAAASMFDRRSFATLRLDF